MVRLGVAMRQRRWPQWHHQTKGGASFQVEASVVRLGKLELPLPGIVVLSLVAVLVLREMIMGGWRIYHDTPTHLLSYSLFGLAAALELALYLSRRRACPEAAPDAPLIPDAMLSLAYALFSGGVGVLFSFHSDPSMPVGAAVHTLLYQVALAVALVHVAEMFLPRHLVLAWLRVFGYLVFGLWLVAAGFVLVSASCAMRAVADNSQQGHLERADGGHERARGLCVCLRRVGGGAADAAAAQRVVRAVDLRNRSAVVAQGAHRAQGHCSGRVRQ